MDQRMSIRPCWNDQGNVEPYMSVMRSGILAQPLQLYNQIKTALFERVAS